MVFVSKFSDAIGSARAGFDRIILVFYWSGPLGAF